MNLIHTAPSIALKHGGPPRSVTQLCSQMAQSDQPVYLLSRDIKHEVNIEVDPSVELKLLAYNHSIVKVLEKSTFGKSTNLIHHHGIWLKFSHDIIQFCAKAKIPLILSPRGMLEPWALKHNEYKKKLAWWLYQKHDLSKVRAFHATAISEAEQIRKLGFQQPIGVIPNGVYVPELSPLIKEAKIANPVKKVLFLSRLHPKKGLDILLKAWSELTPKDAELEIVGNDEGGYRAKLEKLKYELGLRHSVRISSPKYGEEKAKSLQSADLFVLPSHSENFGIVVAEALSYGVPVITTTGCPWEDLVKYKCGWWVNADISDFKQALSLALRLPKSELRNLGANGRQLVKSKYQWKAIAEQMLAFYQYLLKEGPKPEFVYETT